ncbi:MAG: YheC/YheD family protein [Thalassobaculum sp.]|uniref:YheC/YheD family protein n=1 Tax=Thalassobaculum sp. TaxID=2022740 RepID=UPI0032EB5ECD
MFGTTDIDFESGTIRYVRMTPDGWAPWRGPMPDMVLRGAPFPSDADCPAVARLRALAPFLSLPLPDKSEISEILQSTALAPHVIPYREVVALDAGEVISSFLDEHRRVVLKPASEHRGRGVTFVASDGDDIVVRQNDLRWRLPREKALAQLVSLVGSRRWLVQAMIISRVRDGRVFDVRVDAHKDGNGRWALVRSYVRFSGAGTLVSNSSGGGFQGSPEMVLAGLGDRGVALATRIRRLALRIGETLDDRFHGGLKEVGVDILVDPQHRPWIAEVNFGPGTRFHEFDRARWHISYALHLAGRFRAEARRDTPGRLRARTTSKDVPTTSPPVLGLFHASACRLWAMESRRARALAAEAALQGASLGLFGTTDIDFESATVRYMRMTPQGWVASRGPMPDVVLRGDGVRSESDCPTAARLRALVPFVSWALPDTPSVSAALQSTALAPHVIPYRRVVAPDAAVVIESFLDEHRRVVLKPASASSEQTVAFVACDGEDIVVRHGDHRWRLPRKKGLEELAGLVGTRPWTVQKMIVSRAGDGRAFDIFVHAAKDSRDRWTPVRSYARVSEAGDLATVTHRGSYVGELDLVLAGLGDRGVALAAKVRRLGLQIGETLDAHYGGQLPEIAAGILVDPQHRPWIDEVISEPDSLLHEFERAGPHVAHALQVARRFRGG